MTSSLIRGSVAVLAAIAFTTPALAGPGYNKHKSAHEKVMGMMESGPNIVDTAISVDSLSTLVTAVKAADLVDALSGDGPLTVFAPTNDAFEGLPSGTVETLLEPANKHALQDVLKAHVVAGSFDAKSLIKAAKKNGGTAEIETLSGATLTAVLAGDDLYVLDERGGLAQVATADVQTSNGIVHVVTRVLLPEG